MKKKKIQKWDDFEYLIDFEEMTRIIGIINEVADNPPVERPHPLAETIKKLIIEPLEQYLEQENQRTGGKGHTGVEAAFKFMLAAEDVSQRLQDKNGYLYSEDVNILERLWREWIMIVGCSSYIQHKPFQSGPKYGRMDELNEVLLKTIHELYNTFKRHPSARELWNALSLGDVLQDKEKESGDTKDWFIYWKRPNGKEEKTAFKSFQNRYTYLRKKIKNLK